MFIIFLIIYAILTIGTYILEFSSSEQEKSDPLTIILITLFAIYLFYCYLQTDITLLLILSLPGIFTPVLKFLGNTTPQKTINHYKEYNNTNNSALPDFDKYTYEQEKAIERWNDVTNGYNYSHISLDSHYDQYGDIDFDKLAENTDRVEEYKQAEYDN